MNEEPMTYWRTLLCVFLFWTSATLTLRIFEHMEGVQNYQLKQQINQLEQRINQLENKSAEGK